MSKYFVVLLINALLSLTVLFYATNAMADQVTAQVVDVGAGLCIPIKIESNEETYHILYDAGVPLSQDDSNYCINAVRNFFGESSEIYLMIISHADVDHIYDADEILREYAVDEIIRNGEGTTKEWMALDFTIKELDGTKDIIVCSLSDDDNRRKLGETTITIIPPEACGSENKHSIMVKVELGNYSMILTGDAENTTVDSALERGFDVEADIIFVPHHGAATNSADASAFVGTNNEENKQVIFSSGHHSQYKHPRYLIACKYINSGIQVKNMYRTDFKGIFDNPSDKEDINNNNIESTEWDFCNVKDKLHEKDIPNDDHIIITLTSNNFSVAYEENSNQIDHERCAKTYTNKCNIE